MARRIVRELVDDLDGTPAAETVRFGVDGVLYEIDLSAANAARLREELAGFIRAGRRSRQGAAVPFVRDSVRGGGRPGGDRDQNRAIREWAAAQGLQVSMLGRLKQEIIDQYRAANGR
ncbi:histone-like nucleoid-structuring protein Lsr2 [Dactylosporangium darangshiense]|uniref:Lsr2 family protein n=1 Tax=Dactylosporangium darangshiense TaxID=579108 RepID=A0ABP8DVR9_9ACTN